MKQHITDSRPRAVASGTIFGGVDCYVFGDGSTVLTNRGMLRGMHGKECGAEAGNLARYLTRLPEKYSGLAAGPILEFETPDGHLAHGRTARDFVAMCRAYADMYADGSIHKARIPIARNCIAILAGLADVGIDEVIYRASNWHPAAIVPAPVLDLASIRDAVRAELHIEAASLHARLATLEARSVAILGNTGPVIGESTAELRILAPLREAARIRVRAVHNEAAFTSQRAKLENALRATLGFHRSGGRAWALFPTAKLGEATDAVTVILRDAKDLAGASVKKPVQLSLVGNTNGHKRQA